MRREHDKGVGDGDVVAFQSDASNLITGDNNGRQDVFIRTNTGYVERVSVSATGAQAIIGGSGNPSIDASGTRIAFTTDALNLAPNLNPTGPDVLVRDTAIPTTLVASIMPDGLWPALGAFSPRIDNGGDLVAFSGEGRPVVRDLVNAATTITSRTIGGTEQPGSSPHLSGDGRYVAYGTQTPMTPDDTNGFNDVYLTNWREPVIASVTPDTLASGATVGITITGEQFEPGAVVYNPAGALTFSNVVIVNDTTITADMTAVAAARALPYLVAVDNPDGGPGPGSAGKNSCQCVTIT